MTHGHSATLLVNGKKVTGGAWSMSPPSVEPAPSADERALLAAIVKHPDEDTPRLMYADWCDENGQPERAEFIRVWIELARLNPPAVKAPYSFEPLPDFEDHLDLRRPGLMKKITRPPPRGLFRIETGTPPLPGDVIDVDVQTGPGTVRTVGAGFLVIDVSPVEVPAGMPRRFELEVEGGMDHYPHRAQLAKLRDRADELVTAHGDKWVPRVNALWVWNRGFVERIERIDARDWVAHGDAIRAAHPVTRVRLASWFWTDPEHQWLRLLADTPDESPLTLRGDREAVSVTPAMVAAAPGDCFEQKFLAARWPGIAFELPTW